MSHLKRLGRTLFSLNSLVVAYGLATLVATWFLFHALHSTPNPLTAFISSWLLAPFFGISLLAATSPLVGLVDNRGEFGKAASPQKKAAYRRKVMGTVVAGHVSLAGNVVSIVGTNWLNSLWPHAASFAILSLVLPVQMVFGQGAYYITQSALASGNSQMLGQFKLKGEQDLTGTWKRRTVMHLLVIGSLLVIALPTIILVSGWGLSKPVPAWMPSWGGNVFTETIVLAMGTLVSLASTRASIKARAGAFDWTRGSEGATKNATQMWRNWWLAAGRTGISYGLGLWLATLPIFLPTLHLPYAHQLTLAAVGLIQQFVAGLVDLPRSWVNGRGRRAELTRLLDSVLLLASRSVERTRALLDRPGSDQLITYLLEGTGPLSTFLRELNMPVPQVLDALWLEDLPTQQFATLLADESVRTDLLGEQAMRDILSDLATPELARQFYKINEDDMEPEPAE